MSDTFKIKMLQISKAKMLGKKGLSSMLKIANERWPINLLTLSLCCPLKFTHYKDPIRYTALLVQDSQQKVHTRVKSPSLLNLPGGAQTFWYILWNYKNPLEL